MADIILVAALVVAVACGIVLMRRRATKGSACCGPIEDAPTRLAVTDRNKSHYPFVTTLDIGGMTCENCAIRVENALNALPGTWATVSIASKQAVVRTKNEPDRTRMHDAVSQAGYVVL